MNNFPILPGPPAPGEYVDINVYNPNIGFFLQKFRTNEHFAITRFQDQWWVTTNRIVSENPSYDPKELGRGFNKHYHSNNFIINEATALENFRILSEPRPNLYVTIKAMKTNISRHIPKICPEKQFLYAHCWRQYSTDGRIMRWFNEFSDDEFILIGPNYYRNFGKKLDLKNFKHVHISGTRASEKINNTVNEAHNIYKDIKKPNNRVFIISVGGFAGNAIVSKLYDKIEDAFILELGRALDAFYCHDPSFRNLPKFWWSPHWFGNKDRMKPWTNWIKQRGLVHE